MCGENYFKEKPSDEAIREARDIIAKWSSSDLLDQISTLPQIPALSERYVAEIATSSNPAELEPPLDRPIEATAEAVPAESPASPPPQILQPLPDTFERLPTNQPDLTADDRITAEAVATHDNPAPITPPHKVSAPKISDQPPTSPLNKAVETGETSDPQPRKMLPRKPQPRQQRQRTQPLAAADQGMKPMSRKLRVDSPGGDQPELPNEQPTNVAGGKIQSNSSSGARRRIDSGEPVSNVLETGNRRTRTQGRPRQRYIDDAHDAVARGPHFEVVPNRRSNLTSITGQFLAYLGVLGLTIGTAMVIYGHFGGYSQYTPTGWLVTTVAQMMLFLGVINLVSGGMEQTSTDVSQRMEYLGAQLMRIEQVTEEALRGPKIAAHRYADPDAAVEEHDHAHVGSIEK